MSFTYLFYQHIMFRHSCGKCHFTNTKRPSDVTLADFWGWEKTAPNINKDDKGVSLILINTEKGRELFDKVKDRMTVIPARIEDCMQPNLRQPSKISPLATAFERDYERRGFEYALKKYGHDGLKKKVNKFKGKIKRKIKKIIGL